MSSETSDVPTRRTAHGRRRRNAVWGACALMLLTACSTGSDPGATSSLPSYTGAPATTSAAATATPSTSGANPDLTIVPSDPLKLGIKINITGAKPEGDAEEAAYAAWEGHLYTMAQAYNGIHSIKKITKYTTGRRMQSVSRSILQRADGTLKGYKGKGQLFTVGTFNMKVTSISSTTKSAKISACFDDQSYEVNESGKTVFPPPGMGVTSYTVTKTSQGWKVSQLDGHSVKSC